MSTAPPVAKKFSELSAEGKKDALDRTHRMMSLFIESTKTYLQLSSAGLGLCVFMVGKDATWEQLVPWIYPCTLWIGCMFAASGYQLSTAKWLERLEVERLKLFLGYTPRDLKSARELELGPRDTFRLMLALFYAGALAFLFVAGKVALK